MVRQAHHPEQRRKVISNDRKSKSLAQTELTLEVFIASSSKPETGRGIHQTSRTLRGVGSTSRRPGRAQTKDVILNKMQRNNN